MGERADRAPERPTSSGHGSPSRGPAVSLPHRADVLAVVMPALLGVDPASHGDPDEVGTARIVAAGRGLVAGVPIAREAFGRMGSRTRPLVDEGSPIEPGQVVAEVGGPLAAIRAAAPVALDLLTRLSAVASGARAPAPGDVLEAYASRLSAAAPVGDDGPSFHLDIEG